MRAILMYLLYPVNKLRLPLAFLPQRISIQTTSISHLNLSCHHENTVNSTMVNCHISPDIKQCALHLWQHGWSQSDICWIFCVSQASLYQWRCILEEFESVEKPSSGLRGHPCILGIATMSVAKEIYQQHPDTYLDELQWHLQINHDINISLSALQDNLVKAGLTRKILHKIACERDKQLWQDFKNTLRTEFSGTGEEFICIDK